MQAQAPTATDFRVRHAHRDDMEAVAGLWNEFTRQRAGMVSGPRINEDAEAWFLSHAQGLLGRRDALVLVAEDAGRLVAYIIASKRRKPPIYAHTQVAYVSDLYVVDGYRNRGILARFLEELKRWCDRESITAVDVQVFAGNQDVIETYRHRGFEDYRLVMRMRTGEPEVKAAYD